ncbi:MAG: polysaccharide deacetylase family protein [Actinobacteria bacterium]|nr:polysaccharide deacetylase family protein [Actinomycetota bacterium]
MSDSSPRPPFAYTPLPEREPIRWPGDARVAFYVGLNIEHYHVDAPATSIFPGTAALKPDPLNYGWRDYGPRVGIWRMIELLDRLEMPASVLLNSEVCVENPEIVAAGVERDWAWLAHGHTNSRLHTGFESPAEEAAALGEMFDQLEQATGTRPRGWLGPALTETFETPGFLAGLGGSYVLDWCNDDQPYPLLGQDRMISVPYSIELNDIPLFVGKSFTGPQFREMIVDWFDQLYKDGESTGRVMTIALHPFIANQPSRHRYLEEALEHIAGHDGVWLTTSDAIADHYLEHYYDGAVAALAQRNGA